jgi:hypothetical protein
MYWWLGWVSLCNVRFTVQKQWYCHAVMFASVAVQVASLVTSVNAVPTLVQFQFQRQIQLLPRHGKLSNGQGTHPRPQRYQKCPSLSTEHETGLYEIVSDVLVDIRTPLSGVATIHSTSALCRLLLAAVLNGPNSPSQHIMPVQK